MKPFLGKNLLHQLAYNPKHKGLNDNERSKSVFSQVENCEDNFYIYLEIKNKKIVKAKFDGEGCAISLGSNEALLSTIENKSTSKAKEIINEYESFINGKIKMIDGELGLFKIVQKHESRIKCAASPINALREILQNE